MSNDTLNSSTILLYSDKRVDLKKVAQDRAIQIFKSKKIEYVEQDVRYYENIKIGDSREIIEKSIESSYKGLKIFILNFDGIRNEASNALLKVIEEPSNGTFFILITTNKDKIIPTILSRCIKEYIAPTKLDISDKIYTLLDGNEIYINEFISQQIDINDYIVDNLDDVYLSIEKYFTLENIGLYDYISYNMALTYLSLDAKFEGIEDKMYFISNIQNLLSSDRDKIIKFLNRILVMIAFKVNKKTYEILVNIKNSIKSNVNTKSVIYLFLSIILEEV